MNMAPAYKLFEKEWKQIEDSFETMLNTELQPLYDAIMDGVHKVYEKQETNAPRRFVLTLLALSAGIASFSKTAVEQGMGTDLVRHVLAAGSRMGLASSPEYPDAPKPD